MTPNETLRSMQFIDNYFPVIDGVTETVHQYASHMRGATVVCPGMEPHYLEKNRFSYPVLVSKTLRIPLSRYACAIPGADRKLAEKICREKPHIFHTHSPSLLGEYAVCLGRKQRIPVVATFHSKVYDAVLEFTKSRTIARIVTNRTVELYEKCDEVWACSEETQETLKSYGFRKHCFVMPNGTDAAFPENSGELKERAAELFRIPQGKHVLLFVGQMIWYKNQRLILDAYRRVCDRRGDFFLIMTGTGKDEKEIEKYASSLNLTEQEILFTGGIQDRELLTGVYLNAEMLFFPSVFDNAPLVLREAAVLGVPTLATEGSNAAGAIQKNVNGFTAAGTPEAMEKEILRIFEQEDVHGIGMKARETIPLPWEKLIPMVEERYRIVIERYKKQG